ncbi:MAG: hypothetical protein WA715_27635 [Candidatus Acidiferrum sp.]
MFTQTITMLLTGGVCCVGAGLAVDDVTDFDGVAAGAGAGVDAGAGAGAGAAAGVEAVGVDESAAVSDFFVLFFFVVVVLESAEAAVPDVAEPDAAGEAAGATAG